MKEETKMKKCEMDLFDLVMNELSVNIPCMDRKYRRVSAKKGERYKDNYLGVNVDDYAILVFAEDESKLDFAKKVANFYDCDFKVIEHHSNTPEGGKFECKIFIKED